MSAARVFLYVIFCKNHIVKEAHYCMKWLNVGNNSGFFLWNPSRTQIVTFLLRLFWNTFRLFKLKNRMLSKKLITVWSDSMLETIQIFLWNPSRTQIVTFLLRLFWNTFRLFKLKNRMLSKRLITVWSDLCTFFFVSFSVECKKPFVDI